MLQDVFGFPLDVARYQDFGFLRNYGAAFQLHARPDGGLVCFGMQGPRYGRLLIRFAGAALTGGPTPEEAVLALRRAVSMYETLYPHPALIKLQGHGPVAGGYAAIFRWPEGDCLRGEEAQRTLSRQPLLTRLKMIDPVFDLHLFALQKGVAPVGLHDGCLRADWTAGTVTVCDIDPFLPAPAVNAVGRMPGAAQFMAPEQLTPGAPLDGVTAQYALGALAFLFFARYGSRERAAWEAGEALYRVARRACMEQREARYPDLAAFVAAWREAAGRTV